VSDVAMFVVVAGAVFVVVGLAVWASTRWP
jgi:hypothetical protein